ncbi:MAG: hypothetical protein HDR04_03740 [Lachnospiraceae bacterium]|nr:hypothetical protein [Lachnospiraceae bacterium]
MGRLFWMPPALPQNISYPPDVNFLNETRENLERVIDRGKDVAPVEFGMKLDLSIGENGMVRLERLSFATYNESDVLVGTIERYKERIGHYSQRVLVDKSYRNRENMVFCRQHGFMLTFMQNNHCEVLSV